MNAKYRCANFLLTLLILSLTIVHPFSKIPVRYEGCSAGASKRMRKEGRIYPYRIISRNCHYRDSSRIAAPCIGNSKGEGKANEMPIQLAPVGYGNPDL